MGRLPQKNYGTEAGVSNEKDRCQTPGYALQPILPYLKSGWIVWESACGERLLVDALEIAGHEVIATDLLYGTDYFGWKPGEYNVEVTNVPFSRKYDWIERACDLGKPFALLAPSTTMFAGRGQKLIERYGIEILSPDKRIDFKMPRLGWGGNGKRSTAQFHSSWFTRGLRIGQRLTFVNITKPRISRDIIARMVEHPEQLDLPRIEFVQTAFF